MDINGAIVSYRYNVRMPNATTDVETLINEKILKKHFQQIVSGEQSILISTIYRLGDIKLWQPLFDLDIKRCHSLVSMVNNANKLKSILPFDNHIEITNNGIHIVYDVAFVVPTTVTLEEIRDKLKKLSFKCFDVSSSIKDLPIFRVGSYREQNYTMLPLVTNRLTTVQYVEVRKIANARPNEIYPDEKWRDIFKKFLCPSKVLTATHFETAFKKLSI